MYFLYIVTILCFLSVLNPIDIQAISYHIPLEMKISSAEFVVEGYIEQKNCFYSKENGLIYTVNSLVITKVFKGDINKEFIELITVGGKIDDIALETCPSEEIDLGAYGIFILNQTIHQLKNLDKTLFFTLSASRQSFLQYDFRAAQASDGFQAYSFNEIYPKINSDFKELLRFSIFDEYRKHQHIDKSSKIQQPQITSISHSSRNAGTGDSLTITGTNFGSTKGKVAFRNPDAGTESFVEYSGDDIAEWNATQIKLRIPTTAGTGRVRVIRADNEVANSSSDLTINFAIQNSPQPQPIFLQDLDSRGGMTFRINQNLSNNRPAMVALVNAFETWRCQTGVRYTLNFDPITKTCNDRDSINLITFSSASCPVPNGVLGIAYFWYVYCESGAAMTEFDIVFDHQRNWNYLKDSVNTDEYDFESVALHELGHTMSLAHSRGDNDVMRFAISNGTKRRILNESSDKAGLKFILDSSEVKNICNRNKHQKITGDLCKLNLPPFADFEAIETVVCFPGIIEFKDRSNFEPTVWKWDVDNNGTIDYTIQNPTHNYNDTGYKSIRLIVEKQLSGVWYRDTIVKNNYIYINPLPKPRVTGPTSVCAKSQQTYIAFRDSNVVNRWKIENGTPLNPLDTDTMEIIWGTAEFGYITIYQTNTITGCDDSLAYENIILQSLPSVEIIGDTIVCIDQEYVYTVPETIMLTREDWEIDKGEIIEITNGRQARVRWNELGVGSLKIIRIHTDTDCGDTNFLANIRIIERPKPEIMGSNQGCINTLFDYSALEIDTVYSYRWSVEGGRLVGDPEEPRIQVIWDEGGGNGKVSLAMTNNLTKCSDTTSIDNIPINPLPRPSIDGIAKVCRFGTGVYSTSAGPSIQNRWTIFGGEIVGDSNRRDVSVRWTGRGTSFVKLYQTNTATTCMDSVQFNVEIESVPTTEIFGDTLICKNQIGRYAIQNHPNFRYVFLPQGGLLENIEEFRADIRWINPKIASLKVAAISQTSGCVDTIYFPIKVLGVSDEMIVGDSESCPNCTAEYTFDDLPEMTRMWEVEGGDIISGQGTNRIIVRWSSAGVGIIRLLLTNGEVCGSAYTDAIIFNVLLKAPPPINIAGSGTACQGETSAFSIEPVPGASYLWTASNGTIIGSNNQSNANVLWNQVGIGNISVRRNVPGEAKVDSGGIEINIMPPPDRPVIGRVIGGLGVSNRELYLSYTWYKDGVEIPDEIRAELLSLEWGAYRVRAFDRFGCSNISGTFILDLNSVENIDLSKNRAFPNPASDIIYYKIPEGQNPNIIGIYDALGNLQIVESGVVNSNLISFDLTKLTNGIYFLKVGLGKELIILPIVKID